MEHRGEILGKVLKELGVKKRSLAQKLNKHPNTITNWLNTAALPDALILEIGAALHYDFSPKIPTLQRILKAVSSVEHPNSDALPPFMVASQQLPSTVEECHRAMLELQREYMALLKSHVVVLSKLAHVA
jgi:hypothetical protein